MDYLALNDAIQLIENIDRYCEIPNWRSLFGAHIGVSAHGPVGFASLSAETVGAAVATFIEWEQVQSPTYQARMHESEDVISVEISDTTGNPVFEAFFYEALSRAMEILIIQLCGLPKTQPTMLFKTSAQNRIALLQSEYLSDLHFNCAKNLMQFPKQLWNQPSPLYNRELHKLNLHHCRQLLARQQNELRLDLKIKYLLHSHFQQSVEANHTAASPPTLSQISRQVHMSERTLIRKLNILGQPFKTMLTDVRKQLASELLKEARYTVFDIAAILGYQETANFCRAFKNWYGVSPVEFRRQR